MMINMNSELSVLLRESIKYAVKKSTPKRNLNHDSY